MRETLFFALKHIEMPDVPVVLKIVLLTPHYTTLDARDPHLRSIFLALGFFISVNVLDMLSICC